jgi:hypothetical protein
MNNKINKMKEDFDEIEIPQDLDTIICESIDRGKRHMRKRKIKSKFLTAAASFTIIISSLIIGINTSPTFAQVVTNATGSPKLVRILQFNSERIQEGGNKVGGGQITDGKDIKAIDIDKQDDMEKITISIHDDSGAAFEAGSFEVEYFKYPYSIIFRMDGVRAFSAINDFVNISGNNLIGDIYRIITLDDSAQRFAVTFNKPVELKIKEMQDPAQVIIEVKEDKNASKEGLVYSLRSASFDFGEEVGYIEERLSYEFEGNNVRMLRDREDKYIVEEGYYSTEEEARARLDMLNKQYDMDFELYIEERNTSELPKFIK